MTFNYIKTDLTGPKDGQVKLKRDLQNSKVFFLSKLLSLDGFFSLIRSLYARSYVMYATNFFVKSDVMILLVNLIAEKYFCLTPYYGQMNCKNCLYFQHHLIPYSVEVYL